MRPPTYTNATLKRTAMLERQLRILEKIRDGNPLAEALTIDVTLGPWPLPEGHREKNPLRVAGVRVTADAAKVIDLLSSTLRHAILDGINEAEREREELDAFLKDRVL